VNQFVDPVHRLNKRVARIFIAKTGLGLELCTPQFFDKRYHLDSYTNGWELTGAGCCFSNLDNETTTVPEVHDGLAEPARGAGGITGSGTAR
ncbi:MAG TPA: hypothetical protein VGV15_18240, partial [Terriglobales bacterium]|nr:hypothetical protein [Terriglobales bacterium]